ncbi:MAG TPA: ankyrin repeat domain-containing protein [Vicinamibacteria bacterium]|nr:ankyrin repeat domain-containing protein [Vicinamibacteria bacterium]
MIGRKALGLALALAVSASVTGTTDLPRQVADAAARGDVVRVQELLRNGADVNTAQGDGMTALHWAASRGNLELAEVLLYSGANVGAGTRIGRYTPLHLASRGGYTDVVEALLRAKADPGARTTNSGVTPLHLAAASGSVDVVRALLPAGADVNAAETSWGQTPLVFAASHGQAGVIRALLDAGADPNAASRAVNVAEMEKADEAANKRIAEILDGFKKQEKGGGDWKPSPTQVQVAIEASRHLQRHWPEKGAAKDGSAKDDKNAPKADAKQETTTADASAPSTNLPAKKTKDSKSRDENPASYGELVESWGGLTPLLHAVRQGHSEAALALLDGGADINLPSSGDHTTPLLMAAVNGQFDLARKLLERGANPNLASAAGTTPLFATLERTWAPRASYAHPIEHQQQKTTYLELLEALLEAGADPNVRLSKHLWYMEYTFGVLRAAGIDYTGATPFWRAAYALDVDAMRLLKAHGADPNVATMKTPARRRRGEEDAGFKESVSGTFKSVAHFFNLGNPEVPVGGPHIYPIHAASGVGYGQSFAGNAHRYVPNNWVPAVKFLVEECGADVNMRDANGYTALHHAASRGDNALILYLVDRGADVKAVSRKGQTTADMANGPIERVTPFPETIALLVKLGAKNNNKCVSC